MKKLSFLFVLLSANFAAAQANLGPAKDAYNQGNYAQAVTLLQEEVKKNPKDPEVQYYLGLSLKEQGQLSEAVAPLEAAQKAESKNIDYVYALGSVYTDLKRYDESKKLFETIIGKLKPKENKSKLYYGLAQNYIAQDLLNEAQTELMKSREADPNDPYVYLGLAESYDKQKIRVLAIDNYREALKLKPDWIDVHYRLAKLLQREKQYDDAKECYIKVLEINPNHPTATFDLANLYFAAKRYQEAIDLLVKFTQTKPDSFPGQYLLALSYKAMRQPNDALPPLEKAVQLRPKDLEANKLLVDLYFSTRNYEKTIQAYTGIVQNISPDSLTAKDYLDWGRCYGQLKNNPQSIEKYKKSLELNPDQPKVYADVATLLLIEKRQTEAVEFFDKAIAKDPSNSKLYFYKAYAFMGVKDWAEAVKALGEGLKYAPDDIEALTSLARCHMQMDSNAEAGIIYEKILQMDSVKVETKSEANKNLGFFQLVAKNYPRALGYLRKHVELEPKSEIGWLWLAQAHALSAQIEEAKTAYRRVLQINPNNENAKKDLKGLEGGGGQ